MSELTKQQLVDLLVEGAKLEHCLLDAYLYTAAAVRCTPQEFATLANGKENVRRAIQFERARMWKQVILEVTHEEMLHLHYVQTLLRSLGERPSFALPDRTDDGVWIMRDWRAMIGTEPADGGEGVQIPMQGPTIENVKRFVLYEASDALQDMDPFGPEATDLYGRLADVELTLRLEQIVWELEEGSERAAQATQLRQLYTELLPGDAAERLVLAAPAPAEPLVTFQSIGDLYRDHIVPGFATAFEQKWVRTQDRNLVNELRGREAGEGFLPVKDVYRDKNFEKRHDTNSTHPLIDVKSAEDIIAEIVEEGEGIGDFQAEAEALIDTIRRVGARAYLEAVLKDQHDKTYETPEWLAKGQAVRTSHLYRFAVILMGLEQEQELAAQAGTTFDAERAAVDLSAAPGLGPLTAEVTQQFNACYVVLTSWLSRMYEIQDWLSDRPRRLAIEMLASWPLMSMGIRPMLELASFLPVDRTALFRLDAGWLPEQGTSRELLRLWLGEERNQDIKDRMDTLALDTLDGIADWAASWSQRPDAGRGADPHAWAMMQARLQELSLLREFSKEFPYRQAGGYSDTDPDLTYQQLHPTGWDYSENPSLVTPDCPDGAPLFAKTLMLRLRFGGWGLLQLATDPDPTFDESGVTGTHMLHAGDGDRRFDRALVWDVEADDSGNVIDRGPTRRSDPGLPTDLQAVPEAGVGLLEVALCVAAGDATVGYAPIQVLSSTGAVQASGLQQKVQMNGVEHIVDLRSDTVAALGARVTVLRKDGAPPALVGLNHVVSQDGEAIDPFILSIAAGGTEGGRRILLEREVYNGGLDFTAMEPFQRLNTSRRPVGADYLVNLPAWGREVVPERYHEVLGQPGFGGQWLADRAATIGWTLGQELSAIRGRSPSQAEVDQVISYAERLARINMPRSTTLGWLPLYFHYGHSLSGDLGPGDPEALLTAVHVQTGLPSRLRDPSREVNGRWFTSYGIGLMDTDSLRNVICGELYVPLALGALATSRFSRSWRTPLAVDQVSAVASRFDAPCWGTYTVDGDRRTATTPSGAAITDILTSQSKNAVSWTMEGIEDLTLAAALVTALADDGSTKLSFKVQFDAGTEAAAVAALGVFAWIANALPAGFAGDVGLTQIS